MGLKTLMALFAISFALLGCESTLTMGFRTKSPVNASNAEDPTTSRVVTLRVYQLQDVEQQLSSKFNEDNIGNIVDNAEEYLEAEYINVTVPEPLYPPKENQTHSESDVTLKKLDSKTTHIGIVALFDQSDGKPRVQLLTIEEATNKILVLTGYHIEFVQDGN